MNEIAILGGFGLFWVAVMIALIVYYLSNGTIRTQNRGLRAKALEVLEGNWGNAVLATLMVLVLLVVWYIIYIVGAMISFGILALVALLCVGTLFYGHCIEMLEVVRGNVLNVSGVFTRLKDLKVWKTIGLATLYYLLWSLLAMIIPIGVLLGMLFSATPSPFQAVVPPMQNFEGFVLPLMIFYVLAFIFSIPIYIKLFSYMMVPYILHDNPELGCKEIINKSVSMMQGNKKRFFLLMLSFTGWYILSMLTFGLGALLLGPYVSTTVAAFYEDLKNKE